MFVGSGNGTAELTKSALGEICCDYRPTRGYYSGEYNVWG